MDTRKITLIATIAAIALVAVGIGYAYTASTTSINNNASTQYVVMTQTGYSFGTMVNDIDTNTTWTDSDADGTLDPGEVTTSFKMHAAATQISEATAYYGYKVGTDHLTATYTGNNTPAKIAVTLSSTGFTDYSASPAYWKFILTLKDASNDTHYAVLTGTTWAYTNNGVSGDYLDLKVGSDYTTELWFGAASASSTLSSPQSPTQTQISNGTITYTADSSTIAQVAITSMSITTYPTTLAVGASDATLAVTTNPADIGNNVIVWTTSDASIATIVNGKLHAEAAGIVTVTATVGGHEDSKEVTITEQA